MEVLRREVPAAACSPYCFEGEVGCRQWKRKGREEGEAGFRLQPKVHQELTVVLCRVSDSEGSFCISDLLLGEQRRAFYLLTAGRF